VRRHGSPSLSPPRAVADLYAVPGHPRFFLGSDSAPHPALSKTTTSPNVGCAAGVYTSSHLLALCAALLDSFGALDKLIGYVSLNGRRFYGLPTENLSTITVRRSASSPKVERFNVEGGGELVPFWEGKQIGWEISRD
jgi:dihydroorotase